MFDRTDQHDNSGYKTLRSVFTYPCCSSYMHEATRYVGSHAGCVAPKQTGTGKARQVDSGLGNWLLVLSHHLVGQLDMDGFHRRFTNVSVHQIRMQTASAVSTPEA